MAASRVKSKNLFNFRLAGVVDADIVANEKEMMVKMGMERSEMMDKMTAMTDEQFGIALNGMMDGMTETMFKNSLFSEVWTDELVFSLNIDDLG